MKIRLSGTAAECAAAVDLLRLVEGIEVVEVSGSYANRGDSRLQRVYIEARLPDPTREARR